MAFIFSVTPASTTNKNIQVFTWALGENNKEISSSEARQLKVFRRPLIIGRLIIGVLCGVDKRQGVLIEPPLGSKSEPKFFIKSGIIEGKYWHPFIVANAVYSLARIRFDNCHQLRA